MLYRLMAEATMLLHILFLAYMVFGGFAAWRWPRTWFLHLAVVMWGIIALPMVCPLTYLENMWRVDAGQEGLHPAGFIAHYIEDVWYPAAQAPAVLVLITAIVLASWGGVLWRLFRGQRAAGGSSGSGGQQVGQLRE